MHGSDLSSHWQWTDSKEFYHDVTGPIPPNTPKSLGKPVDIQRFVYSNHTGDKQTKCSHSGFLIYVNTDFVYWHSKHQATIKKGVFGIEVIAMKMGVDTLSRLRYKIRMMGVAVDIATYVYGDNMLVIKQSPPWIRKVVQSVTTWSESQSPWGKHLWHTFLD